MPTSVFDLFKIGVGPSSSHTMGPMTAACEFGRRAAADRAARVCCELYGSLALTGKGHATDRALILGFCGVDPAHCDPDQAATIIAQVNADEEIQLGGTHPIPFQESRDIVFHQRQRLDFHSNGMRFLSYASDGALLAEEICYSVGGGSLVREIDIINNAVPAGLLADVPFPFRSGAELLELCSSHNLSMAELVLANECAGQPLADIRAQLAAIRVAMSACIDRGMRIGGELPGGLRIKRRAPAIHAKLIERQERTLTDPLSVIDWVNLWALAVNEENAAGGRVVTAPTNGAAGIVPAVLRYYERLVPGASAAGADDFLLTATAIGAMFKENASISGAEVGCQGEVGVACSMAAAGLAAALGATPAQIENAAEIGMEHNLGLTCDPIGGLVQVPCIERNAVGAIKAIEAARLALFGDGTHMVSLDQVIDTMRRTGADMNDKYKETSLGGLAVNLVAC